MSFLKSLFETLGNECGQCGTFLEPIDLLCNSCWERCFWIHQRSALKKSLRFQHSVVALWEWTDSRWFQVNPDSTLSSENLAWLIYRLKGGKQVASFYRLAATFTFRYQAFHEPLKFEVGTPILVPAPAKVPGAKDHALIFAQQLSQMTGFPLNNCLRRVALNGKLPDEQKKKIGAERSKLSIRLASAGPAMEAPIIFIDDIVTTGATAESAWVALGQPRRFQVWCLATRT